MPSFWVIMNNMYTMTTKEAAEYLGLGKPQVNRLINKGKLKAELQNTPVPYYLIGRESVEAYKLAPKDKGGRPRKGTKE